MSTRCNVVVKNGENNVWLYRHYDGYLSEAGYNLACTMLWSEGFQDFIQKLLEQKNDPSLYRSANNIYEISCEHGDIEYLYEINFLDFSATEEFRNVEFKVKHRVPGEKWKMVLNQKITDFKNNKEVVKKLSKIFEAKKADMDKELKMITAYQKEAA
tara:strand:- start:50 stop:520 length:471 start_codon:yes stop_codon:yes gene_type:complete